jgi:hypothetical protein
MGVARIPVGSTWSYENRKRVLKEYNHASVMGVMRIIGTGTQTATPPALVLDTGAAAANRVVEVGEIANRGNINLNYYPASLFQNYYSVIKFYVGIPNTLTNPTATMWWGFQLGSFGSSGTFPWGTGGSTLPCIQVRVRGDTNNIELVCGPGTGDVFTFSLNTDGSQGFEGILEYLPGPNIPNSEGRCRVYINGILKKEIRFEDVLDWPDFGQPEGGLGLFATSGSNAGGRIVVPFGPISYEGIPL